jgi:hypothetical protein
MDCGRRSRRYCRRRLAQRWPSGVPYRNVVAGIVHVHQRLLDRCHAAGGLDWPAASLDSPSVRLH